MRQRKNLTRWIFQAFVPTGGVILNQITENPDGLEIPIFDVQYHRYLNVIFADFWPL